ncbi:nuclear transport factor 2 family protein [Saccharopolyspora sp. NPDC050642]|uniref:nuclear transport factor 2 family protein n=1 Tax=Saccharopolyspora sp. NPDC050642 TaxID=3157099 RepID=UPI0033E62969
MTDPLTELLDGQRIREVVLRYCRGIDRLDFDLVRSAYHPGGIDHHTGFDGTVDEFVEWVRPLLSGFTGTMHIVGNHLCELRGDQAVAETYGTAVHWGSPESDPRRNFISGFRYVDHMAKRDGRWAIVERFAVREWTHSTVGAQLAPEGDGPRGSRDADDPYYVLARRIQEG